MLRMALLWWLSEFLCQCRERCRNGCRLPQECLYGRICEPTLDPRWPPELQARMGATPPPAYALWDLHDRRTYLEPGAAWGFELTLIGALAVGQIPAIVTALVQGAEEGMIPDWLERGPSRLPRLRSRVRRVAAWVPAAGPLPGAAPNGPATGAEDVGGLAWTTRALCAEQADGGQTMLTWQDYRPDAISFGFLDALRWAQGYTRPVHALSVRYLSPVRIRENRVLVTLPEFSAVLRQLVRRLRMLSVVHGAEEWPREEYGPLLDLAEMVRLDHHETTCAGYTRRSRRSGEDEVEGFVGQAWYSGSHDLRPLLPLLWLGQWLHIGKECVMGNGRYALELPEAQQAGSA
jgi:hypothetical protein